MTLLQLIGVLVLFGVVLWIVNLPEMPIAANIKKLINVAVVAVLVLWLVSVFLGLPLADIRIPTVR